MAVFLLLHGIPGSGGTWDAVAATLRHYGHDVHAPDLLGFNGPVAGVSRDALLAPAQATQVLHDLDERGVERVVLAGHDFGGPVAAHLLAAAPDRVHALALFATNAFPDTPVPFPLSAVRLPVLGPVAERLLFSGPALSAVLRHGVGRPHVPLPRERYLRDDTARAAVGAIFAASLRRMPELYAPVERALAGCEVPALVGWGDRDPFFPVHVGRRTAELVGAHRLRVYDGAGHFLPDERPSEVAGDLLELEAAVRRQ